MSKRRLNYLSFDDVIVPISLVLMENWTDSGGSGQMALADASSSFASSNIAAAVADERQEQERVVGEPPTLDKDFLTSLRDLKVNGKGEMLLNVKIEN